MDQDDQIILSLLLTDIDQGYVLLLQKYIDRLYVYVLRLTRNIDDAQDIIQEMSLRAYDALSRYSPQKIQELGAGLRAWLYKMARNIFLNSVRKQKQATYVPLIGSEEDFTEVLEDSQSEQPEQIFESKETKQELENLIAVLPEKYREVIHLRYFEGLKSHEIADILQLPDGTIRQWERRALAQLRKSIIHKKEEV